MYMAQAVTAWMRMAPAAPAPDASATRAQARRAARSLAMVANWSASAVRRNVICPSASSTSNPAATRVRR
ncbi:MAG: hypothetical protein R2755_09530 [Acidimicrobiales bacterium]